MKRKYEKIYYYDISSQQIKCESTITSLREKKHLKENYEREIRILCLVFSYFRKVQRNL